MAFNWATFRTRTGTAAIFLAVMLLGLLGRADWNSWAFLALFTLIHTGCWLEYLKLMGKIDPGYRQITPFHKYGIVIAGWAGMLLLTNRYLAIGEFTLASLGWWLLLFFIFVFPLAELLFTRTINLRHIGYSLLGLLYISLPCALMVQLRYHAGWTEYDGQPVYDYLGWLHPLIVFIAIWITDTMAYIVGSLIGKRPFFPSISPKKTWEGTLGGIVLAILVAYFGGSHSPAYYAKDWVIMIGAAAIFGTVGDLLESKLKRMAGVKDSGSIMPGHGGFLDRFDSMLLAVYPVWLYITFFIDP